jgi:hypothetical protein
MKPAQLSPGGPSDSPNTSLIHHPGQPCGERIGPPCGSVALKPYRAAERLRNRFVVCHACAVTWRPSEAIWCPRGRVE